MSDYALIVSDALLRVERFDEKPEDMPHKNAYWLEYLEEEGETAFSGILDGKWVTRIGMPGLEEIRLQRLSYVAERRWAVETSGISFNGMSVPTDTTTQTKIIGAVVGAQIDPTASINWKMNDGTFVMLDATGILAVAMAIRAHVQACFDHEATLRGEIEAAVSREDLDAVDISTGWPGQ